MGRITLEEKVINYVRNALDLSVGNTGYPVLGRHLETSGVASRKQLRALEKKGHILSIEVYDPKGTKFVAYYTERKVPEWVTKQEGTLETVSSEV